MQYLRMMILCLICLAFLDAADEAKEIAKAPSVGLGDPVSFTINPKGHQEWFKVVIPSAGYLQLRVDGEVAGLQLCHTIVAYDQFDGARKVTPERPVEQAQRVAAGSWWVRINDEWNDGASQAPITGRFVFTPETDAQEPNDSWQQATPVTADGSVLNMAIAPLKESDWFRVTVPQAGFLVIEHPPEELGPRLEPVRRVLRQASDDELVELDGWKRCQLDHAFYAAEPGEYLVEISDEWSDGWSLNTFPMRFRMQECVDGSEPNDRLEDATSLALPFRGPVQLFPIGDHDCYRVMLPRPGQLTLEAFETGEVTPAVQLAVQQEDGSLKVIKEGALPQSFVLQAQQEYVIVIVEEWGDDASLTPFTLTANAIDQHRTPIETSGRMADIALPELVGGEVEAVRTQLAALGLELVVLGDAGQAIEGQLPAAGTELAKGERVAVYCPYPPPPLRLPQVIGKDAAAARAQLEALGLVVVANAESGLVMQQSPRQGSYVEPGGTITLMVKVPPPQPTVAMPDCRGKSYQDAEAILTRMGFTVSRGGRGGGAISHQDPEPGTRVPVRSKVVLYPAAGGAVETPEVKPVVVTIPELRGQNAFAAKATLEALGCTVSLQAASTTPQTPQELGVSGVPDFDIKLQASLAAMQNRSGGPTTVTVVKGQQPAAGTAVSKGTQVVLTTAVVTSAPEPAPPPAPQEQPKLLPVPSVLGKWKQPAIDILKRQGFRVITEGKNIGLVSKQSPAANSELAPGGTVTITIGR